MCPISAPALLLTRHLKILFLSFFFLAQEQLKIILVKLNKIDGIVLSTHLPLLSSILNTFQAFLVNCDFLTQLFLSWHKLKVTYCFTKGKFTREFQSQDCTCKIAIIIYYCTYYIAILLLSSQVLPEVDTVNTKSIKTIHMH